MVRSCEESKAVVLLRVIKNDKLRLRPTLKMLYRALQQISNCNAFLQDSWQAATDGCAVPGKSRAKAAMRSVSAPHLKSYESR